MATYKEGRTNKRKKEENTLPQHLSMSTRSQVTERFRIWDQDNPPAREEGEDEEQDGEKELDVCWPFRDGDKLSFLRRSLPPNSFEERDSRAEKGI